MMSIAFHKFERSLFPLGWKCKTLIPFLLIFWGILTGCNSLTEGDFPDESGPVYPDFELEKVGELQTNFEGVGISNQPAPYSYPGQRLLSFIRIYDYIVAVDLETMDIRWTLPENLILKGRRYGSILFFDWADELLLIGERNGAIVDPETGDVLKKFSHADLGMDGGVIGGHVIDGQAYLLTVNQLSLDSSFLYQLSPASEQANQVASFAAPYYDFGDMPFLFPYDEGKDRLFVAFPIHESGEAEGTYIHYLNVSTQACNHFYLDSTISATRLVEVDVPPEFSHGILSFSTDLRIHAYDLENNKLVYRETGPHFNRMGHYIFNWADDRVRAFDLLTETLAFPNAYSPDLMTAPLLHPKEQVAILIYRHRIMLVELHTGQLLTEHAIPGGTPTYFNAFIDARGRLCIIRRDQKVEFFELPI